MSNTAFPPGPRGSLILGNMRRFVRDPLDFVSRCARDYGDVASFRFLSRRLYFLSSPDAIESVLVTNHQKFIKGAGLRTPGVQRVMGKGLVTSEGDFWRRQRRLAQPAFHRERIAGYGRVTVNLTRQMLDNWDGSPVDLHKEMMRLTLHIVARTLFAADVTREGSEIGEALDTCVQLFATQWTLRGIFLQRFPTPDRRRLDRAIGKLDEIVYRIIAEHRASPEEAGDLLGMLMAAQDEDGSQMTDRQLRDEAMTIFLAGHETTATALCWTLHLLMSSPEVEAKLQAELETVLGGRPPAFEDLRQLVYAEQIVKESMRLYPPIWAVGRQSLADFEAGGYRIPAGSQVLMSQWVAHHDPRYFEQPEEFRPGRWTEAFTKQLHKFAYFPFGGGPRNCIGSGFAMMETVLILAVIAQRFQFQRTSQEPVTPFPSITLRPSGSLEVIPRKRTRSAAPIIRV